MLGFRKFNTTWKIRMYFGGYFEVRLVWDITNARGRNNSWLGDIFLKRIVCQNQELDL